MLSRDVAIAVAVPYGTMEDSFSGSSVPYWYCRVFTGNSSPLIDHSQRNTFFYNNEFNYWYFHRNCWPRFVELSTCVVCFDLRPRNSAPGFDSLAMTPMDFIQDGIGSFLVGHGVLNSDLNGVITDGEIDEFLIKSGLHDRMLASESSAIGTSVHLGSPASTSFREPPVTAAAVPVDWASQEAINRTLQHDREVRFWKRENEREADCRRLEGLIEVRPDPLHDINSSTGDDGRRFFANASTAIAYIDNNDEDFKVYVTIGRLEAQLPLAFRNNPPWRDGEVVELSQNCLAEMANIEISGSDLRERIEDATRRGEGSVDYDPPGAQDPYPGLTPLEAKLAAITDYGVGLPPTRPVRLPLRKISATPVVDSKVDQSARRDAVVGVSKRTIHRISKKVEDEN